MRVFGADYAGVYDYLYYDKQYERECDFIEEIFLKNSLKVKTILDIGCGTGGHALILAKRGYKVTGVDKSQKMLEMARQKAKKSQIHIDFLEQDMCDLALDKCFDCVISMFAVMSYHTKNEAIASVCSAAFKHLNAGGLFIFDCWNGMAVLTQRPTNMIKEIDVNDKEKIIRFTRAFLKPVQQAVDVEFHLWHIKEDSIKSKIEELHTMRFFFPQEIRYFLEVAGFKEIRFCPFLDLGNPITEQDWNMTVTAKS